MGTDSHSTSLSNTISYKASFHTAANQPRRTYDDVTMLPCSSPSRYLTLSSSSLFASELYWRPPQTDKRHSCTCPPSSCPRGTRHEAARATHATPPL